MEDDNQRLHIVYENTFRLLTYLGYPSTQPIENQNNYNAVLARYGHVIIVGENKEGEKQTAVILHPNSSDMVGNKIVNLIAKQHKKVILIVNKNKQRISLYKKVRENPKTKSHVVISGVYDYLIYYFPDHITFTKYEIMTDEEFNKFSTIENKTVTQLPCIYASAEPYIFWSGAVPGNKVKCMRYSYTAGMTVFYRRVL